LIRRYIDPDARFVFGASPKAVAGAIPYDMFTADGFGHVGNQCTFETLVRAFSIPDKKVHEIAQAIHDADLGDDKYGRAEALGIDRALIGWAQQGISDDELLHRGMQMIDGLYHSL